MQSPITWHQQSLTSRSDQQSAKLPPVKPQSAANEGSLLGILPGGSEVCHSVRPQRAFTRCPPADSTEVSQWLLPPRLHGLLFPSPASGNTALNSRKNGEGLLLPESFLCKYAGTEITCILDFFALGRTVCFHLGQATSIQSLDSHAKSKTCALSPTAHTYRETITEKKVGNYHLQREGNPI